MKIGVDAMGGDHAPLEIIKGCLDAVSEYSLSICLIGQIDHLQEILTQNAITLPESITLVHASELVEMGEAPSLAFKRKKDSSIRVGIDLLKDKKIDAFVSAGNTGAVMTTATLVLGRIPGVERPAIASVLPGFSGPVTMLDLGSNVDCKPSHLYQFAIMGHHFSKCVMDVVSPKVALLNIGEEPDKGDQLSQETYALLKEAPINFIGNLESKYIVFNKADVIVCDGFVGNNLLKFGEGVAEYFMKLFKRECKSSLFSMFGALFMKTAFKRIKEATDYEEFGGAPLLGVNGVTIIAHGKSHAKAIKNAIYSAKHAVETKMVERIASSIHEEGHS